MTFTILFFAFEAEVDISRFAGGFLRHAHTRNVEILNFLGDLLSMNDLR